MYRTVLPPLVYTYHFCALMSFLRQSFEQKLLQFFLAGFLNFLIFSHAHNELRPKPILTLLFNVLILQYLTDLMKELSYIIN